MTNSENEEWNLNHNGTRVPINNTGTDGAPFTLGSWDTKWADGSINKAIKSTIDIQNIPIDPLDVTALDFGKLDFLGGLKYLNIDMLYGFNGDIRNQYPANFTGFRGYPTATLSHSITVATPESNVYVNYNGEPGSAGQYCVFVYDLISVYKMPYPIEFTTTIEINTVEVLPTFAYKIEAGFTKITHYRDTADDIEDSEGNITKNWISTLDGFHIAVDTSTLTGDLTAQITIGPVIQDPYYGILDVLSSIVLESEYNPITPSPATAIGSSPMRGFSLDGSLDLTTVDKYLARIDSCNELSSSELYPRIQRNGRLYLRDTDTLEVGVKLYSDENSTVDAIREPTDVGVYFWFSSKYYSGPTYGSIWDITRFLILDENSIVTYINVPGPGYLGDKCWIQAWSGA